jgi:hypothetical protein
MSSKNLLAVRTIISEGAVVGVGAVVTRGVPLYAVIVDALACPTKRVDLESRQLVFLKGSGWHKGCLMLLGLLSSAKNEVV